MIPPKFLSSLIFLILTLTLEAQQNSSPPDVSAKIEHSQSADIVELKATATNTAPVFHELNYVFIAMKEGSTGNRSNNKQEGKFVIQPNETKKLSEMGINLASKEHLKVYLYVRDEKTNTLISKDSLEINPKKKALAKKK